MDIILFTKGYPYSQRDVFVRNEISALSEGFNHVYIFPLMEGKIWPSNNYNYERDQLPDNVSIYSLKSTLFSIFRINKNLIKETLKLISFNLKKNIYLIRWYFHANVILNNLKVFEKSNKIIKSDTILYSYWFHDTATAIACADKDYSNKITRAHGYDVYEEVSIQFFKRFISNNISMIYVCSKQGANYIRNKYHIENCEVMYLGTFDFFQGKMPFKTMEFNILSCSRIVNIKRLDKIIDVLGLLKIKAKWTHIGDYTHAKDICDYAEKVLGKKNNITYEFLGVMDNNDIMKYLQKVNTNLFINLSDSEGIPVAIMEAMSFSIPTIATDVGGVSEIIKDGINGFLVKKETELEGIASYIEKINDMPIDQYSKICENARETWKLKLSIINNMDKFIKEIQ